MRRSAILALIAQGVVSCTAPLTVAEPRDASIEAAGPTFSDALSPSDAATAGESPPIHDPEDSGSSKDATDAADADGEGG